MSTHTHVVSEAQAGAQEAVREATVQAIPWVEKLARFGYAAKGVVYAIVGLLALQLAFGRGGAATGPEGALVTIGQQPFGRTLLVLMAIGLLAYALWRFVQAAVDPEHKGKDAKGLAQRAGYVVSGLTYGALGILAARMAMGQSGGGSGSQAQQGWTARLLSQPFGVWLVVLLGLLIVGIGIYQFYYGVSGKFRSELKLHEMSQTAITWATRSGKLGYAAAASSTPSSAASLSRPHSALIQARWAALARRWPNWRGSHMAPGCWLSLPWASSATASIRSCRPGTAAFLPANRGELS